jgi:hypothetical protein
MKILFKALLMVIMFSTSCEKIELKHDLVGSWKLFGQGGGITGSGCGATFNYLILKKNNDFDFIKNDTIIEHGTYTLGKIHNQGCCPYWINLKTSYPPNYGTTTYAIQFITNDSIAFNQTEVADGCDFYFVRQ